MSKDLGKSTSYAYYVAEGGTKTPQEYGEMLVNIDTVATRAEDAADSAAESATGALNSKNAAQTAATTATNKATEATTAATTATNKAAEAQADADAAALDASQALSAASTATTKATEATTAAATATSAKTDAVAANTAAQSAKTAAQTAQTGAETAAASVSASAAQIATNTDDIAQLKSELTDNNLLEWAYVDYGGDYIDHSYITLNGAIGSTVNMTPVSNNGYEHKVIPVKAGDKFIVQGTCGNAPRLWGLTDSDYKLLDRSTYTSDNHTESITVSADGYLISNTYNGVNTPRSVKKYMASSPVADEVGGKIDAGYDDYSYLLGDNNWGYIASADVGQSIDYTPIYNGNTFWRIFDVSEGDKFLITGNGGIAYRVYTIVDEDDVVVSRGGVNENLIDFVLTIPCDGKFIFCSYYKTASVKKLSKTSTEVADYTIKKAEYYRANKGLDVLSAFNNVTCCGDSLTASVVYTKDNGDGTHQTRSAYKKYPMILGHKIGAEAESIATGGYSASDWWSAYSDRLTTKDNQLIIIYLGTNGGLTDTIDTDASGDDYSTYANTDTGCYCKMVAKSLSVGARVLLVKIHQGGGSGYSYGTNAVIDKVAEKFNVAVVDVPFLYDDIYHAFPDGSGSNNLHYNDFGYAVFAERLINAVSGLPYEMLVRLLPI